MADQKLTALDAATTLGDADLIYVVDDVAGTPASKKLTGANLLGPARTTVAISTQTGSYTTVLSDAGKVVRVNSATAATVTIPPASSVAYNTGTIIGVRQAGAGQVTVAAGSGVTINTPETLVLKGQWSEVSLHYIGSDVWDLAGDVEAA